MVDERDKWLRLGIDIERPSAARVYDYYLGGDSNFEVDRVLAEQVRAAIPWVHDTARHNRAFLRRAVRYCMDAGVRQFLDIGSGTPTVGNVHEIAQQLDPDSRVVYVDNEPVAVAHAQLLLEGNENATIVRADLREPDEVCDGEETTRLLDFDQPIAVLMVAILHFIPDSDRPLDIISQYQKRLAPGSHLAISHVTDDVYAEQIHQLVDLYRGSSNPVTTRTKEQVRELFTGFDLIDPGVVWTPEWRPETPGHVGEHPEDSVIYAGLGRRS
ncbi:SAM-dependent methyltransferase [Amycolatopsis nigrescens]|uniref:SAM-dependent methyltransferase n=1 Tax=Amycolatopsis nigrescens TaxID=381445 RepID=UPI0003626E2E